MSHEPKFVKAIMRAGDQIARGDFSAALRTLALTGYLPEKVITKFVKQAPPSLALQLQNAMHAHCLDGLTGDNVFDRSLKITLLLSVSYLRGIVQYFKEKERLLGVIEGLGTCVPLVLTSRMRAIEQEIKQSTSHEKFIAQGFSRVEYEIQFSKYTHPELDFALVVRTSLGEAKKLKTERRNSTAVSDRFEKPTTHEGWLALGFSVKHQTYRAIYYVRKRADGTDEHHTMWYTDAQIAALYPRSTESGAADGMK